MPPVSMSDRPRMRRCPSMTTALVCVDPTSTPPTIITSSPCRHRGTGFAGSERLEEGVDAVFELGLRPEAWIDQVRLDEQRRHALDPREVLAAVGHSGAHRPAALDRVIDDAVGLPIADCAGQLVLAEEH